MQYQSEPMHLFRNGNEEEIDPTELLNMLNTKVDVGARRMGLSTTVEDSEPDKISRIIWKDEPTAKTRLTMTIAAMTDEGAQINYHLLHPRDESVGDFLVLSVEMIERQVLKLLEEILALYGEGH